MPDLPPLLSLRDYERAAQARLSPQAWSYYRSGAEDELTLSRNERAFQAWQWRPRVLRGVLEPSLRCELLGAALSSPLGIAPTALHGLAHPEGELATARAAARSGVLMALSTISNQPVEAVAAEGGALWMQIYITRERQRTRDLIQRAEAAGCRALVVTVDAPVLGSREEDKRLGFSLPEDLALPHLADRGAGMREGQAGVSALQRYAAEQLDAGLRWEDLDWLASCSRLPVVVKGILHPADTLLAAEHGAAGVVISNHGGRQLDSAPSSLEQLPEIVEATQGRLLLGLDGGVRRGSDVLKALALGADFVWVGRPALWALALGGAEQLEVMLGLLRAEMERCMILLGCSSLEELSPSWLQGCRLS